MLYALCTFFMIHKKAPAKVVKRHCLFVDIFLGVFPSLMLCTFLTNTNYVFQIQIDTAPLPIFQKTNYFKYKYSAPPPIFRNTNYFKYKYSASLPIIRNTNYFKY